MPLEHLKVSLFVADLLQRNSFISIWPLSSIPFNQKFDGRSEQSNSFFLRWNIFVKTILGCSLRPMFSIVPLKRRDIYEILPLTNDHFLLNLKPDSLWLEIISFPWYMAYRGRFHSWNVIIDVQYVNVVVLHVAAEGQGIWIKTFCWPVGLLT